MRKSLILYLFLLLVLSSGCSPVTSHVLIPDPDNFETELPVAKASQTPFLPFEPTATNMPEQKIRVGIPEYWRLDDPIVIKDVGIVAAHDQTNTDCRLGTSGFTKPAGEIVIALVRSFNTIPDGFTLREVEEKLKQDEQIVGMNGITVTRSIQEFVSERFELSKPLVVSENAKILVDNIYADPGLYGLIPFEELNPGLKVLAVEGISPYDQSFDALAYPLTVRVGYTCQQPEVQQYLDGLVQNYTSNRDPEHFASILVTGTTALTRAIASKMELNGMEYPGLRIKHWFDQADVTHVSNEVSFNIDCPSANPFQSDLLFCSRPEYIDLFTYMGVDVVELTGNHLTDKGVPALENTLRLLEENGIAFYAAGKNQSEAEKSARFEVNGNKISFLGCNQAGPTFVWLTDTRSGVLRCDMDRMVELVKEEVAEGYLPIFTFQYGESFQFEAFPPQKNDFRAMAEAGAVIVSGSQAHLPMSMEVYHGVFIHYGLGNLFFDQMDIPVVGTRREFLDRHIFYDGKYLGVQLLTAMLEDYSQPRPMTQVERESLLADAFEYYQWVEER